MQNKLRFKLISFTNYGILFVYCLLKNYISQLKVGHSLFVINTKPYKLTFIVLVTSWRDIMLILKFNI